MFPVTMPWEGGTLSPLSQIPRRLSEPMSSRENLEGAVRPWQTSLDISGETQQCSSQSSSRSLPTPFPRDTTTGPLLCVLVIICCSHTPWLPGLCSPGVPLFSGCSLWLLVISLPLKASIHKTLCPSIHPPVICVSSSYMTCLYESHLSIIYLYDQSCTSSLYPPSASSCPTPCPLSPCVFSCVE